MSLLIMGNIASGVSYAKENSFEEVYFSAKYYSGLQREFWDDCYTVLMDNISTVEKGVDARRIDFVSGWPLRDEKKIASIHCAEFIDNQSLLIKEFDFSKIKTFTQFRQIAEKMLPKRFYDYIILKDDSLKQDLDLYFSDEKAKSYFQTRNNLLGKDFSTKFSKYLSSGRLDVRYLYNRISDYEDQFGKNKSTYWIKFELLWREFFYHSAKFYNDKIFSKDGIFRESNFSPFESINIESVAKTIKECPPIFSAFKELVLTGYLSNRMRQIFASFWINDLKLDWRLGAKLFEMNLIDYDAYINYGNWQYLAGVGHDPRGKRYFNLDKQMKNYDPSQQYVKHFSKSEVDLNSELEMLGNLESF